MTGADKGVCPSCGKANIVPFCLTRDMHSLRFLGFCLDCGAKGPEADSYDKAMTAWRIIGSGGNFMEDKKNGFVPANYSDMANHLCGGSVIASFFGVSRAMVTQWKAMGAPIFRVGRKDHASYPELWGWLKANAAKF